MESSPESTKKVNKKKGRTPQRNKIALIPPTGDTPRRSPRLSKSKPLETLENEPVKKRGKKSSSGKGGNRKGGDDEETEAPDEGKKGVATTTAEKQTAAVNHEKDEQIVLGELRAPPGWTKKLNAGKDPTSKRNGIVFISPTGEKIKNKRQLNQFLKSNPGGSASSEFYWGTGDTPRRSPRISKSKLLETLENEPTKKRRKKLSSSKEGNRKDNDNEEAEASDEEKRAIATARVAEGTQARSDVEMEKAEDGREMNEEVPNGEMLPGGGSLNIIEAGSKDENEEKITESLQKTKCSETGNKMDSNTKEKEMNTAEEQTEVENHEKEEQTVLGELHAPPGWTKKLIPEKSHTSKRNEIVFISPTGEKIKNKRQLNQFLKSNPGGPASCEFYWGVGDTPRRSPRLSKSKPLETSENEPPKMRGRKSSLNRSLVSEFRDDRFSVSDWVRKDFVSRDGHMKLGTHVSFASIDQRSESAGGESACAVLVVVIANWFQTNHDSMPTDSQFDNLIREGSMEWRNLCAQETNKVRFPDKHLDLQTVLQANIRPVSSASEKSLVGFFLLDEMDKVALEFLKESMSFDRLWDEISSCAEENCVSGGGPQVYIVSWNDHFFILKVETKAYYLMDTFGERLYEGCNKAYILKFDEDTTIHRLHEEVVKETEKVDQLIMAGAEKETDTVPQQNLKEDLVAKVESRKREDIVCKGKESCKEYIKSFLAAVRLRDLQDDIKKGPVELEVLLQCLQIEFHYVVFLLPNT